MRIYNDVSEYKTARGSLVTIGTFDGVHKGHQELMRQLNTSARTLHLDAVVLTFHPHPRLVIFPDDNNLQLLNTLEEKIEIFRNHEIEHLIIQPFTREFSRLNAVQFVRDILVQRLKVHTLIIGHDHHFGQNRQGNIAGLEELAPLYGFKVSQVEGVTVNDVTVSSTKIRHALLNGDVQLASDLLGYNYRISGIVVPHKKIGRTLGFPTANMRMHDATKLVPAIGVYAVTVTIYGSSPAASANTHYGMLSIGRRPTFDNGEVSIETYILDFDEDIYGREITVEIHKKLRDDKKFESVADLTEQMKIDEQNTRTFFASK